MLKFWTVEGQRYWIRFQVFLIVNGGLLAIFPIVINPILEKNGSFHELVFYLLIGISIVGIIESTLWLLMSKSSKKLQDVWRIKGETFENEFPQFFKRSMFKIEDLKEYKYTSVTKISYGLPILFMIVWSLIFLAVIFNNFGIATMPKIDN